MFKKVLLLIFLIILISCSNSPVKPTHIISKPVIKQILNTDNAYDVAIWAYNNVTQPHKHILIIVDFTKPSSEKRMIVINMDTKKVILKTWVAHGIGSGSGEYVEQLSNEDGSKESSIGVFRTAETYYGHRGYSLRIDGLESGYNNNVRDREIVIHGAPYIGNGETGQSWGCFAVSYSVRDKLINYVKNGAILVAYFNDS